MTGSLLFLRYNCYRTETRDKLTNLLHIIQIYSSAKFFLLICISSLKPEICPTTVFFFFFKSQSQVPKLSDRQGAYCWSSLVNIVHNPEKKKCNFICFWWNFLSPSDNAADLLHRCNYPAGLLTWSNTAEGEWCQVLETLKSKQPSSCWSSPQMALLWGIQNSKWSICILSQLVIVEFDIPKEFSSWINFWLCAWTVCVFTQTSVLDTASIFSWIILFCIQWGKCQSDCLNGNDKVLIMAWILYSI